MKKNNFKHVENDFFTEGEEYTFMLNDGKVFKSKAVLKKGYFWCTDICTYKCTSIFTLVDE